MSIIESWRAAKAVCCASALALLVASCAAVPYQEMSDARQAIESAHPVVAAEADEDDRSARMLRRARELLEQAEGHLEAREYDRARATATRAKSLAIEARERARAKE